MGLSEDEEDNCSESSETILQPRPPSRRKRADEEETNW